MFILGLDLSLTAAGVVIIDAHKLTTDTPRSLYASTVLACKGPAPSTDMERAQRLIALRHQLDDFISLALPAVYEPYGKMRNLPLQHVFAENYAFGRSNQAHYLGELGGVISTYFAELKREMTRVSPSAARSLLLAPYPKGQGRRPNGIAKKEVAGTVRALLGKPKLSGDICDAWAVANYGASQLGLPAVILR